MLNDSLAQSKMYFQLLHLLRIMPLWIRDTKYDLMRVRDECIAMISQPDPKLNQRSWWRWAHLVRQNWDEVLGHFCLLENELQKRIDAKVDEIRGLRDGSTSMNRYIIIFTTLTVFYLPLGFVTAVFSMDLLHDENLVGMKSQYAGTMVLVAIATYLAAVGLIALVCLSRVLPAFLLPKVKSEPSHKPVEIKDMEREWGKHAHSGPWSGILAIPGPNPRQR
ncbi:hypothetical protein N658DRAFT_517239 [Parathielavia hyrcaniae]|uniref:Uncharacterized protein n=1 Tax=Parathielavia hyrcaniae TaxID=113614 RepID=A0AAN6T0F0_9PEZI|nr:hypothetical protein N658DRAFT_517239 [Parathielavia hyrcaniae]